MRTIYKVDNLTMYRAYYYRLEHEKNDEDDIMDRVTYHIAYGRRIDRNESINSLNEEIYTN